MNFYISQELLLERAVVVWATILLFGVLSIGGLWRRQAERIAARAPQDDTVPAIEELAELVQAVERLGTTVAERKRRRSEAGQDSLAPSQ